MALILSIETSTQMCSVALSENGTTRFAKQHHDGYSHASHLTVLIESLMQESGMAFSEVDAIAVSSGPGSYTGLRIGISTAKGICYAMHKPLIAINSLEILAWQIRQSELANQTPHALLCPMIDARRMEVYTTLYNTAMQQLTPITAEIIDNQSFATQLNEQPIIFAGNGADKCHEVITHPNALFIDQCMPLAHHMAIPAQLAFHENRFEDVAYMEPLYLKDFVATTPKNKVF